jgi:hypothetical protein
MHDPGDRNISRSHKPIEKILVISFVRENRLAMNASTADMLKQPWGIYTSFAWHYAIIPKNTIMLICHGRYFTSLLGYAAVPLVALVNCMISLAYCN